jgi:hypothetical protein
LALNELMDAALEALPDGLAVCYIDMPEALVLTRRSRRPFSQEVLDALAATAARLLDGKGVAAAWRVATGRESEDRPAEALAQNAEHTCLFLRVGKYPDHALCVLARRGIDIGQMRAVATQLVEDIANAI